MKQLEEAIAMLKERNEEGVKIIYDILKCTQHNERLKKETTAERLEELKAQDQKQKEEKKEDWKEHKEIMKSCKEMFERFEKESCKKYCEPDANEFLEVYGNTLYTFLLWNPKDHYRAMKAIFSKGYQEGIKKGKQKSHHPNDQARKAAFY